MIRLDLARFERATVWIGDAYYHNGEAGGARVDKTKQPSLRFPRDPLPVAGPILVVDDDPAIREIIVETLELEGYPVEQAANGAEALRKIEDNLPSVVLLDMRMPILDGWGLVSALRQRGLKVPIVVMTAAKNARIWANEIGASAYLDKPFEDTDLLAIVERFHGKLPKQ